MNIRRVAVSLVLISAFGAALSACSPSAGPPDTAPALRGVIVSVTPAEEGGAVRVVWHESVGDRMNLDAADVRVLPETDVFASDGSRIGFAGLQERDIVNVWISGPVAESYPVQGTADAIEVVGQYDDIRPLPIPPGLVEPQ